KTSWPRRNWLILRRPPARPTAKPSRPECDSAGAQRSARRRTPRCARSTSSSPSPAFPITRSPDWPATSAMPAADPVRRRSRGFTLVEALVAVAILAMVALLAWRATAAMTDGEAHLAAESARWQRLDALLTRMEADMREAIPRNVRHGPGTEASWSAAPEDAAGNTLLIFSRAGADALDEPGAGGQRVAYRWRDGRVEV